MDEQTFQRVSQVLAAGLQAAHRAERRDASDALAALTASLVELGVADYVGVTELEDDGTLRTRAPTDQIVTDVDRVQYELREGPCVDASYDVSKALSSSDIAHDGRWPRWGPAAAALGVSSVVSIRLYEAENAVMGALNLYTREIKTHTADDLDIARIAASHIAVELAHHHDDEQLWQSIDARHRIGQAQGILMERFDLDETTSFAALRRFSQSAGASLAIVADSLARTRPTA